ncbi:hypothetical protein [Cellulomonas dongxiuzhuiae]|uniref:hypothetical protein n=1 Tax=Cellulomonas dongxiuzhuiae TaxID=2819979 RepID=UPI001AAFBCC3|nr:hypothetical protein [Cellulomonas dongxiuzhuiae]MBO3094841.1 hypothetical protein [Cellulomonas dongxiuzhuiae]
MTTAPFILLALSGGLVFGPMPVGGRHRAWRLQRVNLLVDGIAVLSVLTGAAVSLLVLAEQVSRTDNLRLVVMYAGMLSLLMLGLHVTSDVLTRYVQDRDRMDQRDDRT